ncbi:MAG TPA: hypothetical protein VMV46_22685 [Thermoanaerobaculia bacterium]|nr:hypothetical protein [Thermoanaerobaculia bacterium]
MRLEEVGSNGVREGAERREEARSVSSRSGALSPGVPDSEVAAKAQRLRFTAAYKLRILEEVDAGGEPGEVGATEAMSERLPDWDVRQAACVEYSPQLLHKYLRNRTVTRVRRGVYRLVDFPVTQEEDLVPLLLVRQVVDR